MRVQTNSTKNTEPNTYTICLFQMHTRALALHHALSGDQNRCVVLLKFSLEKKTDYLFISLVKLIRHNEM